MPAGYFYVRIREKAVLNACQKYSISENKEEPSSHLRLDGSSF